MLRRSHGHLEQNLTGGQFSKVGQQGKFAQIIVKNKSVKNKYICILHFSYGPLHHKCARSVLAALSLQAVSLQRRPVSVSVLCLADSAQLRFGLDSFLPHSSIYQRNRARLCAVQDTKISLCDKNLYEKKPCIFFQLKANYQLTNVIKRNKAATMYEMKYF